jgi:RHS repeat-associated protein
MGSMTWWNANTYENDAFGMPWRVTLSGVQYHYLYTADDERIWTFQSGAPSRWTVRDLDGQVLREFKNNAGTWSVERDYVYRDGVALSAVTATETQHLHPDHLGTPRLITGNSGAYKAYHAYHPFGSEATSFNQDTERLKFTAHERDLGITTSTADDLDYMHARFYNMQIGRLLATDPSASSVAIGMPQSWNRYSYALANPMKFVDPSGAIVEFADKEAKKAYDSYKSQLDQSSEDYANVTQLEKSDITYVINIENLSGSNEGSLTFDGQKVFLNVDAAGGGMEHSLESRLAHEVQHGVQVDNGEIGFRRDGNKWTAQFVDIGDEVSAWNASVRQASRADLARGPVADYNRAKNKMRHLYQRGYGQLRGTERGFSVPKVPGFEPGSVLHSDNAFWRIPR